LGQALYYEKRLSIDTKEWEEGKQGAVRTYVSLGRTWLAHSELGMVSHGTRRVVVVGSQRSPGCLEGKSGWVRNQEFDGVAYAWRWKGLEGMLGLL